MKTLTKVAKIMSNPTPITKQNNAGIVLFVGIMSYVTLLSIIIFILVITGFERSIPIVSGVYAGFGVLVGALYKVFRDVSDKLNVIGKQTNGNLSRATERADLAEAELKALTKMFLQLKTQQDSEGES